MRVFIGDISYDLDSIVDRGILIMSGLDPEKLKRQEEKKQKYFQNQKIKKQYKCED